ncbi:MAG: L-idonate 5-dehydrogenase [Granulosicoccus sp.]|nr:L-idonate 5-dehydrogenase [Granulosicoccus sp.]
MQTIVIHAAKDLRIQQAEVKEPGTGQIQITLAAGGICGSDLHYYHRGGIGESIRLQQPMILGHEVSGYVSALGEEVNELKVGQLVAVSPSRPCYQCRYCQQNLHNHCENMRFYGSAMPYPHIQGAFREVLVADARQCVVADGLSAGVAAMAEPLSVCLHAVRRAGEVLGKRVLITGSGPIGTLSVLAARAAGAAEIVVTDIADAALKYSQLAGADRTVNVMNEADAMAQYVAGKGYFDILLECSGTADALGTGIAALRPRGVIMQLGLGGDMTLPVQALTAKELDLRGSFRFHEEFAVAVSMMRSGMIDVKPLISHTFPLAQAVEAFDVAGDRTQAMKVQLQFG